MTVLKSYEIEIDEITVPVKITAGEDYVSLYKLIIPEISTPTLALLDSIKEEMLKEIKISFEEIFDPIAIARLKKIFYKRIESLINKKMPSIPTGMRNFLSSTLLNDMIGLGKIEILLMDGNLEEIAINTPREPVWVYHKQFGWLKTNLIIPTDKQIQNYASIIARRVGRQVTLLEPLLDAHLITGDRANATLFPVSTKGNTISIRKFARKPWTITDFLNNRTVNLEIAAFLWLAMQYELNFIIAGGTSSGKTALLNSLMPFIQPNHRIISIEDTREIQLPDYLHWVPLTTRRANPDGKGEVSMLDLMINSLRMRPDRIVIGEIRRAEQAEVLFEAMHTGHSVYSTLHADTVDQTIRRLTNPPINIPEVLIEALHVVIVQHRDRRTGLRRTYQVAEMIPTGETGDKVTLTPNILYRYKANDEIVAHDECVRVFDILKMLTGMTQRELFKDMKEKIVILDWLRKENVNQVNDVGKIIVEYYADPDTIHEAIVKKKHPSVIIKMKH